MLHILVTLFAVTILLSLLHSLIHYSIGLVSVGTDLANVEVASPSIRDLTPNAASPRKDETAFLPSSSSTSGVVPPLASRSSKSSKQRRSSILSGKASEASTKTDSRQLLIMQLSLHAADVSGQIECILSVIFLPCEFRSNNGRENRNRMTD